MNAYFVDKVALADSGCWEWTRFRNASGYGQATIRAYQNRPTGAHRLSYEMHIGPIPEGMTVDHMCFNPPCVNPEHLRLLTRSENAANQLDSYKTHCVRGHEYTPETTRVMESNGKRGCKICHRDRERLHRRRRVALNPGPGRPRGEVHYRARLTAQDVPVIRARRAAGDSVTGIARDYGVSRPTVQDILAGRTWTHVPQDGAA